ncbi:MAG: hypothetical protein ACRDTA_01395 [Pseudonocardiaceae bacterium]
MSDNNEDLDAAGQRRLATVQRDLGAAMAKTGLAAIPSTDVPEQARHKPELGRLATRGRSTDGGSPATLLVVHEIDESWTIHGLGAPGVTLPAADMVALAESILKRAR